MAVQPENELTGLELLAKVAAQSDNPTEVGSRIAYMLAISARIRRDGTPEQREAALAIAESWRLEPEATTLSDQFQELCVKLLALMGWDA